MLLTSHFLLLLRWRFQQYFPKWSFSKINLVFISIVFSHRKKKNFEKLAHVAALSKESHAEHLWGNHAGDTNVLREQESSITQVSEKIEARVTKNLSQEFSNTKSHISCTLSELDKFRLNPLKLDQSGSVQKPSRSTHGGNQGTNEDHPIVIPILDQGPLWAKPQKIVPQTMLTTPFSESPGSKFFGNTQLYFQYSSVNATNATNAINFLPIRRWRLYTNKHKAFSIPVECL